MCNEFRYGRRGDKLMRNSGAFLLFLPGAVLALVAARAATAGEAEETAKAPSGTEPETANLQPFEDKEAGYSMRIPAGYTRLTQEENRQVLKSISEYGGKEVSESVQRHPAVYFRGPADPGKPKAPPPSLEVRCTGLLLAVDPAQKAKYLQKFEEDYRKSGVRYGEISLEVIEVSGVNALRAEHDMYSPVDNSRNRLIRVLAPAPDRCFDIIFNFSPHQAEGVEKALQAVLKTFRITERQMFDPDAQTKWCRVALWTLGGFATGFVLSFILKLLSGAMRKPESK